MASQSKSKKTVPHSQYPNKAKIFLMGLLNVCYWVIAPFLAMRPPLEAVFIVITTSLLLLFLSKNSKVVFILSVIGALIGLKSLVTEIPRTIRYEACFEFNVSYPGTQAYDDCIQSLTSKDYLDGMFESRSY